ncbi:MAG TPA: hypothetical protein VM658_16465 [bacterium]|nr:hypothetical protein [bacterium]
MIDEFGKYFRKQVEIRAHGIVYRGMLLGADDDFMYLKALTTWITIPLDSVTAVNLEKDRDWDRKQVPGEPKPDPKDRDGKKRYSPSNLHKVHDQEGEKEWPGYEEDKTGAEAEEEPDE